MYQVTITQEITVDIEDEGVAKMLGVSESYLRLMSDAELRMEASGSEDASFRDELIRFAERNGDRFTDSNIHVESISVDKD